MRYLEAAEIVIINRQIAKYTDQSHALWNSGQLEAAVARHKQAEDIFDSVALLMQSLMNNPPFGAQNTATAFLAGQILLEDQGYSFTMDQSKLAQRLEQIAKDSWTAKKIAQWLKRRCQA